MVSPNHELLSIQLGRCTEIAEMPRPLAFSCMSIKNSASIVMCNEMSSDTGNPAHLVLAEKCHRFFKDDPFHSRIIENTCNTCLGGTRIPPSGILWILLSCKFSREKCVFKRGKLMIRVVLIVLVAAGFIVTGDIPTLVTGWQGRFLAIQNSAMGILNSEKVKILPGGKDQQNKDHLNFGSCTPDASAGVLDREKFPPDATRSVNLKELEAGRRLVL